MKNNKLHFPPDILQSFISIKVSGKSEKPRESENNPTGRWKPMDTSDSQRQRAIEQLIARCGLSLKASFPQAVPQSNLRMEETVSQKSRGNSEGG